VTGRAGILQVNSAMKVYGPRLKKFINGQHVSTGVRIAACVILPAVILAQYGLLVQMMALPLGALFVALTDQPGPVHHRVNGMMVAIFLNFAMVCFAGASGGNQWLLFMQVVCFSFLFSLFGIYGPRADGIGLMALITFIISFGALAVPGEQFIYPALYFAAGGAWYALFSLITNTIQPYKPAAQMLGEYLQEIGDYLNQRAALYEKNANVTGTMQKLFPYQVTIQQHQASLRELLFKTRLFVRSSSNKGRRLMMIFLESTDLLERVMTAQQNYTKLHSDFDDSGMLEIFHHNLEVLSVALTHTGLAVQNESSYQNMEQIDKAFGKSKAAFLQLRQQKLDASTVAAFIRLRHVLNSIEDVGERIKRLQQYTASSVKVSRRVDKKDVSPFTTSQHFTLGLLSSNLSLGSVQFRHALRFTIAMAAGFILSQLLSLGHSYWVLLTIATILKPSFSMSRQRNIDRITGTFAGAGVAFAVLQLTGATATLLVVMVVAMVVAYIFLKLNNVVSTACMTLYVVLSFHFLYPAGVGDVLRDRVLDTIIGAAISLPASYFLFPHWEHKKIYPLVVEMISSSRDYFRNVAVFFSAKSDEAWLQYKLARKAAFIALANVSDALQRMLTEPKNKQDHLQSYHQLVTASHMLTSYIASLAYYAEQYEGRYDAGEFRPMLQYINRRFDLLQQLSSDTGRKMEKTDPFPANKKLRELMARRKQELEMNVSTDASAIAKQLSVMKTIADQLQLTDAALQDIFKVLERIKASP
jgi:uncharacterized membrane protein (TIGR01666 family)